MGHEGVKPHACPDCDHRTISFVNLQTHMKLVHKKKVTRKWHTDELGTRSYSLVCEERLPTGLPKRNVPEAVSRGWKMTSGTIEVLIRVPIVCVENVRRCCFLCGIESDQTAFSEECALPGSDQTVHEKIIGLALRKSAQDCDDTKPLFDEKSVVCLSCIQLVSTIDCIEKELTALTEKVWNFLGKHSKTRSCRAVRPVPGKSVAPCIPESDKKSENSFEHFDDVHSNLEVKLSEEDHDFDCGGEELDEDSGDGEEEEDPDWGEENRRVSRRGRSAVQLEEKPSDASSGRDKVKSTRGRRRVKTRSSPKEVASSSPNASNARRKTSFKKGMQTMNSIFRGEKRITSLRAAKVPCLFMWFNFRCRICHVESDGPETFLEHHVKNHAGLAPFVCHLCLARFENAEEFQNHVVFEETEMGAMKEFVCFPCKQDFSLPHVMDRHVESEHGPNDSSGFGGDDEGEDVVVKPYQCNECGGLKFRTYQDFILHRTGEFESHLEPEFFRSFNCIFDASSCGFKCRSEAELKLHLMLVHQSELVFKCPRCGSEKHVNETHVLKKPYECAICQKQFASNYQLRAHKEYHKEKDDRLCPICGKTINSQPMSVHIRSVHNKEYRLKCSYCDERFKYYTVKTYHERRVHTGESLKCETCGREFAAISSLKSHRFRVHGERSLKIHTCRMCNKEFPSRQKWKVHEMSHNGLKPHACPQCDHRTLEFKNLKTHIRLVHKLNVNRVWHTNEVGQKSYTIVAADVFVDWCRSDMEHNVPVVFVVPALELGLTRGACMICGLAADRTTSVESCYLPASGIAMADKIRELILRVPGPLEADSLANMKSSTVCAACAQLVNTIDFLEVEAEKNFNQFSTLRSSSTATVPIVKIENLPVQETKEVVVALDDFRKTRSKTRPTVTPVKKIGRRVGRPPKSAKKNGVKQRKRSSSEEDSEDSLYEAPAVAAKKVPPARPQRRSTRRSVSVGNKTVDEDAANLDEIVTKLEQQQQQEQQNDESSLFDAVVEAFDEGSDDDSEEDDEHEDPCVSGDQGSDSSKRSLYSLAVRKVFGLTVNPQSNKYKLLPGLSMWFRFRCRICGAECKDPENLLSHHNEHHASDSLFACHFCFMKFNEAEDFQHHVFFEEIMKSEQKDFVCKHCDEDFSNPRRLDTHAQGLESNDKKFAIVKPGVVKPEHCSPFRCDECNGIEFDTFQDYIVHRTSVNENHVVPEFPLVFRCIVTKECDFKGRSEEDLLQHALKVHQTKHAIFCPRCRCAKKSFVRTARHVVEYEYSPKRYCDECAEFFRDSEQIARHKMMTHAMRSSHICDECGREFSSKRILVRHMLTHKTTEGPERPCKLCGKLVKGFMTEHVRTFHASAMRLKCEFCDARFLYYGTKKKHYERFHASQVEAEMLQKWQLKDDSAQEQSATAEGSSNDLKSAARMQLYTDKNSEVFKVFGITLKLGSHRLKDMPGLSMWFKLQCRLCGHQAGNPEVFLNHHKQHHEPAALFVCHFCLSSFNDAEEFQNHVYCEELLKTVRKDFICCLCNVDLLNPRRLDVHMQTVHGADQSSMEEVTWTPFRCDECDGLPFKSYEEFIYHRAGDHPNHVVPEFLEVFSCATTPGCMFKGRNAEELLEHSDKVHDNKKPFVCPRCKCEKKTFRRIARHIVELEYNPKRYCDECGIFFKDSDQVERHINITHLKRSPHVCEECGKTFISKHLMKRHMQHHKPRLDKLCPICGKCVKGFLSHHVRAFHNREKRLKCELCDERFLYYSSKRKHFDRVHAVRDEKYPNTCKECGKTFACLGNLKSHLFTAHAIRGVTTYPCEICGKEYTEKRRLEDHQLRHQGVERQPADQDLFL
ncbi:unnamed protein product [Notodromas monacha]|uniref:C2H2-type domain-containing protein n=1 Tax=Notodromas monacha TaxID=399045 RepID=A0A7R9BLY5_9CRUS|nr:unnamed protein product [Notodromas monacha]CAG0917656.1 unnamed protein product [Notodromas monacha]